MKNILLVHGYNGVPLIFDYFKNEFSNMGYNVVVPDFPVQDKISVKGYFDVFDKYKSVFADDLVVIAHSIGNPMFLKYISKNKIKIKKYISLAGFCDNFVTKNAVLNKILRKSPLTQRQIDDAIEFASERISIYSDNDHIVPLKVLKDFCAKIKSKPVFINGIGHMGKKSGLTQLPQVVKHCLMCFKSNPNS